MFKYNYIRIAFLVSFAATVVLYKLAGLPWFYLLFLSLLYFTCIVLGAFYIRLNFFMKSICYFPSSEKTICLTFDDGPDPIITPNLLSILKQYNIKANFFIIGKKIKGNEDIIKAIHEDGHIIANHSYSHSYFYDFYLTKKVEKDILETNKMIKDIIGLTPILFRPPYGVTNPSIAEAVNNLTLTSIGWNVRSLDTVIQNKNSVHKRVIKRIKPGSIVLFHDTIKNSVDILTEIILFSEKNGYKIARLDEVLDIKPYEES